MDSIFREGPQKYSDIGRRVKGVSVIQTCRFNLWPGRMDENKHLNTRPRVSL